MQDFIKEKYSDNNKEKGLLDMKQQDERNNVNPMRNGQVSMVMASVQSTK